MTYENFIQKNNRTRVAVNPVDSKTYKIYDIMMSCKSLYDPGNSINAAATAAHMTIKIKDNLSL